MYFFFFQMYTMIIVQIIYKKIIWPLYVIHSIDLIFIWFSIVLRDYNFVVILYLF